MITAMTEGMAVGAQPETITPPGGEMGKEEFLQLLITQLRHQDPLNPMEAEEMAVQLAQFSSVEQLINMNEQLAAQVAYSDALVSGLNSNAALGVLGRTVVASTDQVQLGGNAPGTVGVAVAEPGGQAELRIFDADGKEVGSRSIGQLGGGLHTVELGSAADGLRPGTYTFEVAVTNDDGAVETEGFAELTIDGIRYGPEGPVLSAGDLEVPLSAVREVITTP